MISVWLLFQALWQWVGENHLHYYSYSVLQFGVTVLWALSVYEAGWGYAIDTQD